jgi:putative addiction module component (TIGR02574 family)
MTQETRELLERALKLPPEDRAILAEALHASVEPEDDRADEDDPALRAAWREELARRIRDYREGKVKPIASDEVFAEARAVLERIRASRGTPPPTA